MPKASRLSAAEKVSLDGYQGAIENFEGGWTVAFEEYSQDADLAPFFDGLPDNQCQAIHLGYVLKGRVAFRTANGDEVFEAGDAYFVGPGHTPVLYAGGEVIEFSPTEQLAATMAVVSKNMEAAG